jgi:two-component system, NtrC family, response regulator AtoC
MPASLLIVDDEKHTREGLGLALEEEYEVFLASNPEEAFNLLDAERFDLVLTDLRMQGSSGMRVIDKALQSPGKPITIMMTAYGNVETAVEAMKRGAYDFLTKPVNLERLELLLHRALKSRQTEEKVEQLERRLDERFQMSGMVGHSPALKAVVERIRLVAPSKASVLIEGETGTGKELVAQAIHQNSERARAPFVPVHCAALATNLLESELFGHERGAFTGATEKRVGRFEAAHGGTLFLDEIGEIDSTVQVKLLRFLETRTIERLGSMKPISLDIRLVAATNRDLRAMVHQGKFREDLYFRLNVVTITMPPLRERREDILLLLNHYTHAFAKENNLLTVRFSEDALLALQNYRWPGNIRELRNFAENITVLKQGTTLTRYDLDERFLVETGPGRSPGLANPHQTNGYPGTGGEYPPAPTSPEGRSLASSEGLAASLSSSHGGPLSVEENEKRLIRNALVEARGNRTQAARLLGMSRRTLHRKLNQWPDLDTRPA